MDLLRERAAVVRRHALFLCTFPMASGTESSWDLTCASYGRVCAPRWTSGLLGRPSRHMCIPKSEITKPARSPKQAPPNPRRQRSTRSEHNCLGQQLVWTACPPKGRLLSQTSSPKNMKFPTLPKRRVKAGPKSLDVDEPKLNPADWSDLRRLSRGGASSA
jgi:hypothetical protein